MKTTLIKSLALCISVLLILLTAACGNRPTAEPTDASDGSNETIQTDKDSSTTQTEAETTALAEVDVSAYPVNLLGQKIDQYRKKFEAIDGDTMFDHYCQYEIPDLFKGVRYLTSSVKESEFSGLIETDDAVFEILYSSADVELYPELKIGSAYRDYADQFPVSVCEYNEAFCTYTATFPILIHGEQATVYLFFFNADSICNSIVITTKDQLDFKTLNVKEADRDQYPVVFVGQSVSVMKQKFEGLCTDLSDYDTELRKHVYLGVTPDREQKPVSPKALVKGLFLFSDQWEALPGIRIGDSGSAAGFEAVPNEMEGGDSYPCDTIFVCGFFLEPFINGENGDFTSFTFHCKQLYND